MCQMCLYSHYSALLGKHQLPPGWCMLWQHRIPGPRMKAAHRGQCTLLPQCSWKMSQKDMYLSREVTVKARRGKKNIHPSQTPTNLTKVNIQESSIGSLHQDFLFGSNKSFVQEVHPISHQRTQHLCIPLKTVTPTDSFCVHEIKNKAEWLRYILK